MLMVVPDESQGLTDKKKKFERIVQYSLYKKIDITQGSPRNYQYQNGFFGMAPIVGSGRTTGNVTDPFSLVDYIFPIEIT